MDTRARAVEWLRNEFAAEQCDGFPRLRRVPDTRVLRFLDHFAGLGPAEQAEMAAVLAEWASYKVLGEPVPAFTVERYTRATAFPGRAEGLRYTGVNLLAGLARSAPGGLEGWFRARGVTGLALQLPQHLLRDAGDLVPVRIPSLRRLVKTAVANLFTPGVKEVGDGIWWYEGMLGESLVKVQVRYSGKMGRPQLQYEVEVRGQGRVIAAPNLCFESLLGAGFGAWDYLTEENAPRSVALLCELVEYVARLPERLPPLGRGL